MTCAIMHHPTHLRMYRDAAVRMAANELPAALPDLRSQDPRAREIGGVPYFLFDHSAPLTPAEIRALSRLTFTYALFDHDGQALTPLGKDPALYLDESLSGLLKYTGKTHELFTRLLLHLAAVQRAAPLRILDPLAGKGTTLYEALLHGHHAYGIEADPAYPAEADQYLKKFLTLAHFKHTAHTERISGRAPEGKFTATRYQTTLAPTKDAMKNDPHHCEIIQGDTRHADYFYKKNTFDALVADLPYGVQHGTAQKGKKPQAAFTRNALGLVQEALPAWRKVLKPDGVLALSWNTNIIPRGELLAVLATQGFCPLAQLAGLDFSHRVDQAIVRDVVVATGLR